MIFSSKLKQLLLCILVVATVAGCQKNDDFEPTVNYIDFSRGNLLTMDHLSSWDSLRIDSLIGAINPFVNLFFSKQYDVDLYKVTYSTISWDGSQTTATGAVAIPRGRRGETAADAPLTGYCHGTVLHKDGVPSRGGGESSIGILMATDGYVVAMPDYLGLGDSPGFHPYVHGKSEATAVVDMLRAARRAAEVEATKLNERVFLVGYSQGGHAALATQREIQLYHSDEISLHGVAPMSGPYDISGAQEQYLLSFDPYATPGYLPYTIYSYNLVYDIIPDPKLILKPPYDSIVDANMDQTVSMGTLNNLCNPVPRLMVRDSVMDAYENDPEHPLKVALRDNDLYLGWVPQAPLRMFYCVGDDQVAYENAIIAYDAFTQAGAPNVSVARMDDDNNLADHNACAPTALLVGKLWFDSLNALP